MQAPAPAPTFFGVALVHLSILERILLVVAPGWAAARARRELLNRQPGTESVYRHGWTKNGVHFRESEYWWPRR